MYNIKFVYLFHENVSPALFAKIIRPSVAGQWIMSVPDHSLRSLFTRYDLRCESLSVRARYPHADRAGFRDGQGGCH